MNENHFYNVNVFLRDILTKAKISHTNDPNANANNTVIGLAMSKVASNIMVDVSHTLKVFPRTTHNNHVKTNRISLTKGRNTEGWLILGVDRVVNGITNSKKSNKADNKILIMLLLKSCYKLVRHSNIFREPVLIRL